MKKTILILLAVISVAALVSCAAKERKKEESKTNEKAGPQTEPETEPEQQDDFSALADGYWCSKDDASVFSFRYVGDGKVQLVVTGKGYPATVEGTPEDFIIKLGDNEFTGSLNEDGTVTAAEIYTLEKQAEKPEVFNAFDEKEDDLTAETPEVEP